MRSSDMMFLIGDKQTAASKSSLQGKEVEDTELPKVSAPASIRSNRRHFLCRIPSDHGNIRRLP